MLIQQLKGVWDQTCCDEYLLILLKLLYCESRKGVRGNSSLLNHTWEKANKEKKKNNNKNKQKPTV